MIRNISRSATKIALLLCILALAGCAPQHAWTSKDPWFVAPPANVPLNGPTIEPTRVDLVADSKESQAEDMLADAPYVPLTPQQAVELVGLPLRPHGGTKPYLVRSVYLNRNTSTYDVHVLRDKSIIVFNESLGTHGVPMKRQALVIQLDDPPTRVFVICKMSELAPRPGHGDFDSDMGI